MIFEIFKTSERSDDNAQPHERAVQVEVPNVDERSVAAPEDMQNAWARDDWYRRGTNHRVENGCIKRNLGTKTVWQIEIASLEELLALVAEVGYEVVLQTDSIEIYDDYRE